MSKVYPVLLYVHFVAIKGTQIHSCIVIFFQKFFEKRQCVVGKIINLLRFVFQNYEHIVIAFQPVFFAINAQTLLRNRAILGTGGVEYFVFHVFQFPDVVGIDSDFCFVHLFSLESVCFHRAKLHGSCALVVCPQCLLPHLYAELTCLCVSHSHFECCPFACVPGLISVSLSQFQRAQQA